MVQESSTRIPEPRANARIEVQVSGEGVGGTLQHREAGPSDTRALFTQGLGDCRAIATYTPGGTRTLVHANGGSITDQYLAELANLITPGHTDVIFANGTQGTRSGFDSEVRNFQQRLNAALVAAGKNGQVRVIGLWTEGMYAGMFCLLPDGTYGRCNPASLSSGRKKWCGLC